MRELLKVRERDRLLTLFERLALLKSIRGLEALRDFGGIIFATLFVPSVYRSLP